VSGRQVLRGGADGVGDGVEAVASGAQGGAGRGDGLDGGVDGGQSSLRAGAAVVASTVLTLMRSAVSVELRMPTWKVSVATTPSTSLTPLYSVDSAIRLISETS
jgi:hypothetical protein